MIIQNKETGEKILPGIFEPHVSNVKYTSHLQFITIIIIIITNAKVFKYEGANCIGCPKCYK